MRVLLARLRWILLIPVDDIIIEQHHNVTLSIAPFRRIDHLRQYLLVEELLKLLLGALVADFVQQSAYALREKEKGDRELGWG